jgi:hypothetical protein
MTPSEKIREIWMEIKSLKRMQEDGGGYDNGRGDLEEKYDEVEGLFGHESTLSKAIIYYLDNLTKGVS